MLLKLLQIWFAAEIASRIVGVIATAAITVIVWIQTKE